MLPAVAKQLCRQLHVQDEDLEFALCDHVAENLRPASSDLTHKGQFADFLPGHQTRTVRLLPGNASGSVSADGPDGDEETGVWFLKKLDTGLSNGVTVHESLAAAAAAAEHARGLQKAHTSWYRDGVHLGTESSAKAEYVVQQAVASPWLWNDRKVHFRLYLLAVSPPTSTGAANLRAVLGRLPPPQAEPEPGAEQLETRWYLNQHAWLSSAEEVWKGPLCTDRGPQISATRTEELRNVDHARLWPILRDYAERFVADARGCVQRDKLTPRQQECLGFELFGLDVMVSEDLQHCTALEVNSGPRQCAEEFEMQLGMYEIALGLETTPADEGLRWLELRPPTAAVAGGGSGVASRCSGKVAAWVKSNRVLEPAPEPEPAPAPTRGHESPAAAAVAALVETHAGGGGGEPRGGGGHSTPAAPGDSAVGTAKPHASGAAVGAFLSSMPGLV
jgi:hypothetical protein